MKKRRLISLMLAGVITASVATMAGCDEEAVDTSSEQELPYNYVIIEENGIDVLHALKGYKILHGTSGANQPAFGTIKIITDCCNNSIRTPVSEAVLYENKPKCYAYDEECALCN